MLRYNVNLLLSVGDATPATSPYSKRLILYQRPGIALLRCWTTETDVSRMNVSLGVGLQKCEDFDHGLFSLVQEVTMSGKLVMSATILSLVRHAIS